MKVPDLSDLEQAGVHAWSGDPKSLAAAAEAGGYKYSSANLHGVTSKTELMKALDQGLKLPAHFGANWDALADSLEDEDWLAHDGVVVFLEHSTAYRKAHPQDWSTLEDILAEAADYWRDLRKPFWVFVH
ncbi:MAG: barstar family protein [Pseudomonadota bacterium]|nr:barstar family protein [Pseudomonadota bacterium]